MSASGPTPRFVPAIHGLRGLAILTIVLYHVAGSVGYQPSNPILHGLYESGFMGVDVLFFITGFVLFLPVVLDGSLGDVRAFAIRRWARLAPAYYVALAVVVAMMPTLSTPLIRSVAHVNEANFLLHLSFLQWLVIPHENGFIVDQPVWTLTIDACFYVLLPFIACAYRRRPVAGLFLALVISEVWHQIFIQPGLPEFRQTKLLWLVQEPFFLRDFACGMTGAWLFERMWRRRPAVPSMAFVGVSAAGLGGLLIVSYLAGTHLPYNLGAYQEPGVLAAAFPLCLMVFAVSIALAPSPTQWPLTNRITTWFTEISYSVYLYHYPILFFGLFTLGITRDRRFPLTMGLAALPATLVIATISCYAIERPGRRLGRRLSDRVRRAAVAPRIRVESPAVFHDPAVAPDGAPLDPL